MAQDSKRRTAPGEIEDATSFSSPPCFMHELRPEYLGYMSEAETAALLTEVGQLQAKGKSGAGADAEIAWRLLLDKLRRCLPRIYPSTVRDELEELLQRLDAETG